MNIRYAIENDREQVISLWNYCFEDEEEFVNYYFENVYDEKNTLVVEEDDEVLSSLQLNKYKIKLRNNDYKISYIVGVSSKPEIRGHGYMKNLMVHTLEELYKNGEIVSILMAIDYRLYRRYGFDHCYDQLQYNIRTEELSKFKLTSRLKRASVDDAKILADIYKESMKNLNGYTIRDEDYFKKFIMEIESENGRVYINEENNSKSYIAYYIQGDTFFVRELIYSGVSSLKCVLAYIYNHNTQCKNTVINSPVDDKIKLVVDNLKTCEMKFVPFMAGRMINFKKYLETLNLDSEKIKIIEGKSINIKVKDKYIEQNDGVFKISILNNKINVEKVDEAYDIELNINSIAQLAFSYLNIDEILMLNEIDENSLSYDQKNILNILFEKKTNYIDELV